ncbi:MAG: FkbM family methyltransferase [Cytophagales bacterium]|nr:MAG: FkbM family methyltransferase [Cytophagales bacterium]
MQKINIIDVGALDGFDIPWKKHQDKIDFALTFEPNEKPIFGEKLIKYNTAIWDYDGEGNLYIIGSIGQGSSLLEPNYEWVKENFEQIRKEGNIKFNDTWHERTIIKRTEKLPVKKIDTVLKEVNTSLQNAGKEAIKFNFLKSDTQSGEYYVLKGAENWLKTDCIGLEIEAFRYPMYKGVVIDSEVCKYLEGLGFEQIGWTGYMYSFNAACDYLFVKKNPKNAEEKALIDTIRAVYQPRGKAGIIKQPSLYQKIKSKIIEIVKSI